MARIISVQIGVKISQERSVSTFYSIQLPNVKHFFLNILCRQLPSVPPSVIESEISPLIPDLTRALFNLDPTRQAKMSPAIKSFLEFLKHLDPKVLEGLAPTILPYLIRIAQGDGPGLDDKIAALGEFLDSVGKQFCVFETYFFQFSVTALFA